MGKVAPLFSPTIGTKKSYNLLSGKNQREKDARNAAIQAEEDRKQKELEDAKQALLNEQATVDRPFGTTNDVDTLSLSSKKRKYNTSSSLGIF